MSHGVHREPTGRRRRIVAGLLGLMTCAGLIVGASASASVAGVHTAARNVATAQLQYDLAGLAYLPWSGIDGQTGPHTRAATEAFQRDACISVDGVAGPQTDGALAAKVKQVQAVARATRDGEYGPLTKAAVKSWQRAHGLSASGAADRATMGKMGIKRSGSCSAPPPGPPVSGTLRQKIAAIAAQERATSGHNHEIGGYNCNYYSTALGVGPSGHCANGWRTEEWCADFATWVWRHAGANTGGLNPGAISFKNYGVRHGTWHTSNPRVGDAVVFNVSGGSASHVGLVVAVNGNSFVMISGNTLNPSDGRDDIVGRANRTVGSGGVSGFASPVG